MGLQVQTVPLEVDHKEQLFQKPFRQFLLQNIQAPLTMTQYYLLL